MTPLAPCLRACLAALIIGAGLGISGCVTAEQLAAADYGQPPTNPRGRIIKYFKETLKDPESARIEWGDLRRGYVVNGLVTGRGTEYGHIQIVRVNAKNSFGAYTGWQTYYIMFRGEYFVGDVTSDIVAAKMGGVLDGAVAPAQPREQVAL